MAYEFSELHIRKISIDEDLTDEDDDHEHPDDLPVRRPASTGTGTITGRSRSPMVTISGTSMSKPPSIKEKAISDATAASSRASSRRRRLRKMGQRAASLKFSALDFVALSPDKLKKHYTIGKLLHSHHSSVPSLHSTHSAMSSSHANIHECLHRDTHQQRAVKVVKKSTRWSNPRSNQRVHKEFKVLTALDHPNLVRAYEFFEGKDHYYIIMDLCPGGDLCQELDAWGRLQEPDAALLLKQLLTVLAYCHSNSIVHGNIKPEHILLQQDKDLDHIKLTDFSCADIHVPADDEEDEDDEHNGALLELEHSNSGIAKIFLHDDDDDCFGLDDDDMIDDDQDHHDDRQQQSQQQPNPIHDRTPPNYLRASTKSLNSSNMSGIIPERLGTPDYWSPEVVLKGSSGPKRDIWACGVLCYLVLSNQFPFKGRTQEEICERIIRGEFSFRVPGESQDSAECCDDPEALLYDEYDEDVNYSYSGDTQDFYHDYLDGQAPIADATFSWKDVSDLAKSFIRLLLTYEEESRPTARQALKHPWIVQMTSPEVQRKRQTGTPTRFSSSSAALAEAASKLSSSQKHNNKNYNSNNNFVNSMATMAAWNNVAKFNADSKLKQATLTLIAAQMVLQEERKAIDHVFRSLDVQNDGRLSRKEVQRGYREVFNRDLTEAELDDLFNRVDLNRSGYLEYSEFLVAAMNEQDLLHREKIQQAFSVFDRDGSGTIDKEDLKGVLNHFKVGQEKGNTTTSNPNNKQRFGRDRMQDVIDDEVIDKILKQADSSGDGKITYEDFLAMMLNSTAEEEEEEEEEEDDADEHNNGDGPAVPKKSGGLKRAQTTGTVQTRGTIDSSVNMKTLKFTANDFMSKRPPELTDFYEIKDFIEEGGFGKVYVCRHKVSNAERALKVIDKSRWRKQENVKITNEFELLKGLDHPNIIKFYDLFQDARHFYIVMSICKGGDLCDELDAWGKLTEENAAILMRQVLSCLNYCHGQKIIHRDIKPDNILLETSKDFRQIKIIDFGFATTFENGVEMTDVVGTAEYMAPEVLNRSYYGSTCDVWSVGVVCYLVLSNKFPFREKSREALYQCIVTGTYTFPSTIWDSISEEAQDFVRQLLTVNPKERPTTAKALQHPWLKLADERRKRASNAIQASVTSDEKKLGVAADQSARFALTNMQNFKRSRLQEAVKTFIASQLLMAEEKKAIDETFRDLDITCNGKLSKAEVRAAYFKFFGLPLGDEELDELFRRVDLKHTGFIDYSDFVVATMNEKVLLGRNKLKKAFELFDDDGNGLISCADLKKALTMFGGNSEYADDDGAIKRLIKEVDADGDGNITYDEFVGAMMLSTDEDMSV